MRSKSGILLIVALGCGMVASVGISQVIAERKPSDNQVQLVEILVATRDIDVQEKITADNIRLEKWPQDRLPEGSITKLEDVENRFANQRLFAGEPLLPAKLMDSAESVANKIPPGHRVFDLPVDNNTGGMGYILPGDRVDVIGFFQSNQPGQIGQTQTVLTAVRVFGIDGNTIRDNKRIEEKKAATTIQLLIQDSQLEAMTTAAAMGQLRVSLCPPGVNSDGSGRVDTGASFMSWIRTQNSPPSGAGGLAGSGALDAIGALISSAQGKGKEPPPVTEVAVITPRGVTRYAIGKEGDIPRVIDSSVMAGTSAPAAAAGVPNPLTTTGANGIGSLGSPANGTAPSTPSYGGFPINYPPTQATPTQAPPSSGTSPSFPPSTSNQNSAFPSIPTENFGRGN